MRHRLHFSALFAMFLIGATDSAFAQGAGTSPGTGTVPPQNIGSAGITSAPGGSSTTSTGMGTGAGSLVGVLFSNVTRGTIFGLVGTSAYICAKKGKDVELPAQTGMLVRMDSTITLPPALLHSAATTQESAGN